VGPAADFTAAAGVAESPDMHVAALALALLLAEPGDSALSVGAPAPAFLLPTLNADAAGVARLGLQRMVGPGAEDAAARLVLISFFASWCQPCQKEMPFLAQLDREYRDRGLRVVSVDIDTDEAGIESARKLVAGAGLRHPVVSDRFNIVARRYLGEKAPLPSLFLVRKDGTVARIERGYTQEATTFLRAAVRAELGLAALERPAGAERSPRPKDHP